MSEHLTSADIARVVAGDGGIDRAQHALECRDCAFELERLQDTLSIFRRAVREWSNHQGSNRLPEVAAIPKGRAHRPLLLRWGIATAAVGIVSLIPLYKAERDERFEAQAVQDALLLADIDSRLSRKVPVAMEPLMELFADETSDGVESVSEEESGGLQ